MLARKFIGLAAVLATVLAFAGTAVAEPVSERFDETFPLAAGGRISLDNINGDLHITTWSRNEVRIEAVKEASSVDLLRELEIDVEAGGEDIRIRTHYPRTRHEGGVHLHDLIGGGERKSFSRVEYTLTVPADARLDAIELVNGDMDVAGITGGVRSELVNGTIRAENLAGSVRLSTVNGGIEATYSTLGPADRIELDSVNGRIELALPASASATVNAETVNGRLRNDFGIEVRRHKYVGADMNGTLGAGGADVELSSVNGGIELRRF